MKRLAKRGGVLAAAVFAAACAPVDTAELERGRAVYNFRCYFCHGYSGDARTVAAAYLSPPPRNFRALAPDALTLPQMTATIAHGRPGTAMKAFDGILDARDMAAVAAFVRAEFMVAKAENTRYHTADNGWPEHEKNAAAFPFAHGELALDAPDGDLTLEQRAGKLLFLATCATCHDGGRHGDAGAAWEARPLSYPRNGFTVDMAARGGRPAVDAVSGASPYAIHDRPPRLARLSAQERRGESLYQDNCAFCHAADGTARHWIGRFLEPHPRDLTDRAALHGMSRRDLATVVAEGLPGTSMPAWRAVLAPADIEAIVAYAAKAFGSAAD